VNDLQRWFERYRQVSAKWPRALRYLVAVPVVGAVVIVLPFFVLWRSTLSVPIKVAGSSVLVALLGVIAYAGGAFDNARPAPTRSTAAQTTRTSAPTAAATPGPAAYTIVSRKDVSVARRRRTEVRVVVIGQLAREQKISTLAEITRRERRADVVVVFAFRSAAEEQQTLATVGRATISTDRKGWTGDGQSVVGPPDSGEVQGDVVLEVDERVLAPTRQEPFTAPP
jgi:hypothetical protein